MKRPCFSCVIYRWMIGLSLIKLILLVIDTRFFSSVSNLILPIFEQVDSDLTICIGENQPILIHRPSEWHLTVFLFKIADLDLVKPRSDSSTTD